MIFVTVGTDGPFDRFIRAVDHWARTRCRNDVFAQIGSNAWKPEHMAYSAMLDPAEYRKQLICAKAVISHAGMGTIISALQFSKPILIMPRNAAWGETCNSHQMDTARRMLIMGAANVAFDEYELAAKLDEIDEMRPAASISSSANCLLVGKLSEFIHKKHPVV